MPSFPNCPSVLSGPVQFATRSLETRSLGPRFLGARSLAVFSPGARSLGARSLDVRSLGARFLAARPADDLCPCRGWDRHQRGCHGAKCGMYLHKRTQREASAGRSLTFREIISGAAAPFRDV